MADAHQPHIRWRRLNLVEPRGRRENPPRPPGPPLRPQPTQHGARLQTQTDRAVAEAQRQRQVLRIDPSRLLLLEMRLLQNAERDHLERLGLQIIDETEVRQPVDPPFYALSIRFEDEAALQTFGASPELHTFGVSGTERQRASNGSAHPTLLQVRFADRPAAVAFHQRTDLPSQFRFTHGRSEPQRVASRTAYRAVLQFPDQAAIDAFRREEQAYSQRRQSRLILAPGQRNELFDALEEVRSLGPDDRRGARLGGEGVPETKTPFFLDVDLWHPGSAPLVGQIIREFRDLVARHGGQVTDGPTSVADTLLLARVKATRDTLEALLGYERAARVDLPPRLPETPFSIFQDIDPPDPVPVPGEDGPLACLLDSGVVSAQPLLAGTVVDERDFDSGDGTHVDLAGHGTYVAGIVVYGDIAECLRTGRWEPHVRVLSAKILRTSPDGIATFSDDNEKRIETQIREAVSYYAREFGCRVFNLSLGHYSRTYREGRQLPWALVLDELAHDLDVVLVVAAGNVISPAIPTVTTSEDFQREVRDRLLTPEHALTDPACAVNVLTVGAIARTDVSFDARRYPERRPPLVGSPALGPSPFTRAGVIDATGGGVGRVIKPELVAYGGNYCLGEGGHGWNRNDAQLGEPSLRHDYEGTRLVRVGTGTSVATPFVTHVCARIERQLRATNRGNYRPTANLIRALAVHSAEVPEATMGWIRDGGPGPEAELRRLRLTGFGMPSAERALFSTDQRTVLFAEDVLEEGHFHVYELVLPQEFVELTSRRCIRVTLAYDPPVRGTRRDYIGRRLYFRLVRGKSLESIRLSAAQGRDIEQVVMRPSSDYLRCSTVQSATFTGTRPATFEHRPGPEEPVLWYVLVRCEMRFPAVPETTQRYAVIVSIEHNDAKVRLYQTVRQRVEQRQRVHWPSG
jgi:Subtilase family